MKRVIRRLRVAQELGFAVAIVFALAVASLSGCNELLPIDQSIVYVCNTNDECGFGGYQCVMSQQLNRRVCRPPGYTEPDIGMDTTPDTAAELPDTQSEVGPDADIGPEVPLGVPCGDFDLICPVGATCELATGFCTHTDGMVHIAGGSYFLGCDPGVDSACSAEEAPVTQIEVPAFQMDRLETTVAEYTACVTAGSDCVAPALTPGPAGGICSYAVPGRENHPMNCLINQQALNYCAWRGARLCTETEWELAARGSCDTVPGDCESNMRTYPWGSEAPTCNLANSDACAGDLLPVGERPDGASIYGVQDLSGNVREWVKDGWVPSHTGVPTDGSAVPAQSYFVKRGGSYLDPPAEMRATVRGHDFNNEPVVGGIRCCKTFVPTN